MPTLVPSQLQAHHKGTSILTSKSIDEFAFLAWFLFVFSFLKSKE